MQWKITSCLFCGGITVWTQPRWCVSTAVNTVLKKLKKKKIKFTGCPWQKKNKRPTKNVRRVSRRLRQWLYANYQPMLIKKKKIWVETSLQKLEFNKVLYNSQIRWFRVNAVNQLANLLKITMQCASPMHERRRRIHYNFVPERRYSVGIGVGEQA